MNFSEDTGAAPALDPRADAIPPEDAVANPLADVLEPPHIAVIDPG